MSPLAIIPICGKFSETTPWLNLPYHLYPPFSSFHGDRCDLHIYSNISIGTHYLFAPAYQAFITPCTSIGAKLQCTLLPSILNKCGFDSLYTFSVINSSKNKTLLLSIGLNRSKFLTFLYVFFFLIQHSKNVLPILYFNAICS